MKSVLDGSEIYAHTNYGDTGMPHDSLNDYIEELEGNLNSIYLLADKARSGAGQLNHPVTELPHSTCTLCRVKSDLDMILRLTNPLLR